jgi:hypothetical protein
VEARQHAVRTKRHVHCHDDERRQTVRHFRRGLFEREIGSRVERFGNVAVVRSAYELRRTEAGPVEQRGVNFFTLYHDGTRWYISHIVWDSERPTNRIPNAWITRRTRPR